MSKLSVSTSLGELLEGDHRLDATFYASIVYQAHKVLDEFEAGGGVSTDIGTLSEGTYNPPPIKRIYTDDPQQGTPYMLPQEMFDFYWQPKKYVLADKMADIEAWFLQKNWIVLTQSGTVGKPYLATKADERIVLSQNAIRVPLSDENIAGYLYAYLATWVGQALLKKDEFGITVKHIRPHQVDAIRVPSPDSAVVASIGKKIVKAFELRQEAIKLISAAKVELLAEIDAPLVAPTDEDDDGTDDVAEVSAASAINDVSEVAEFDELRVRPDALRAKRLKKKSPGSKRKRRKR